MNVGKGRQDSGSTTFFSRSPAPSPATVTEQEAGASLSREAAGERIDKRSIIGMFLRRIRYAGPAARVIRSWNERWMERQTPISSGRDMAFFS